MKPIKYKMIALVFALLLCIHGSATAEQDSIMVEADTEMEAAYIFVRNIQQGIPQRRVRIPGSLNIDKIFAYIDAVYPSKVRLAGLQIPFGNQTVCDYYVQLRDPDEAAAAARAQELALDLVQPNMTQAEKIKVFHDYLIANCEPDLEAQAAVERGETDAVQRYISSFTPSGPLLYGKAVCDGYAGAMMMLCRYADVPCFRISSVSMNHAWNYVFDGEAWRYIDVIFDDSAGSYDHFMLSKDELTKTHQFDDGSGGTVSGEEYIAFFDEYFQNGADERAEAMDCGEIAARMLNRIGMLQGTEDGFELERVPTRNEMAVMLVRILGKETEVVQGEHTSPFEDTGWAERYVGYLYQNHLVAGISETEFGGELDAGRNDYATLLLRTLQYSDAEGDFHWNSAAQTCLEMGIASQGGALDAPFTRGDMAQMTIHALMTARKTDGVLLLEFLTAPMAGAQPLVQDVIAEYKQLSCW